VAGNLSSGNFQNYDLGHGSRILQGLEPDLALLQEMRFGNGSERELAGWVRAVFNDPFVFFREKAELPNTIVSRFPIMQSGIWDDPEQVNREFVWARINLPNDQSLLAVSLHWSAKNETRRLSSAKALVVAIEKNLKPDEWLVIGGDFNTRERSELALDELRKVVVIAAPYPADHQGNENTNAPRNRPLDAVYVNEPLQRLSVPVPLGGSEGGLVFDTRVYPDLEAVPPVQRGDSAVPQMQHMAVVRDFLLKPPDASNGEASARTP
jgi:endonuclease/exonuclease/phosphatase family metal-dependent hydrolase